MPKRQIVRIDQELCNGCGACVTPCAESAIVLGPDGKAHVIDDTLCDGAGFCLGVCPTGALTVETREAGAFDAHAAEQRQEQRGTQYIALKCYQCGASEEQAVLLPCRTGGQSLWVCTHCLPALIHG
jgi:MinD superfamily P-loop ATPase